MSWMILPDSRSTQTANIFLPSGVAVVIQTWLPSTTGDDQPLPWIAVFQTMLVFSLQRAGSPFAPAAMPVPLGPRNWVPLSAARAAAGRKRPARVRAKARKGRRMVGVGLGWEGRGRDTGVGYGSAREAPSVGEGRPSPRHYESRNRPPTPANDLMTHFNPSAR